MRKFKQLNKIEKTQAVNQAQNEILTLIIEGVIVFNDKLNDDDLQARIDKAATKADANRTPWFLNEIMFEDSYIKDRIKSMALINAEDSLYLENNENMPIRLKGDAA